MLTISPNKQVKANQHIAIQEVAQLYRVNKGTLAWLYTNRNKPIREPETGITVKFFKDAEFRMLEIDDNSTGFGVCDWLYISNGYGQKLIAAIDARLATRKAVKQGIDMFPQYANIPEIAKLCPILETWEDLVAFVRQFDTAQEAYTFFSTYKGLPWEVVQEFSNRYKDLSGCDQRKAFELFYNEITTTQP